MSQRIAFAFTFLALVPSLSHGAVNLVSNPGFDVDLSGWGLYGSTVPGNLTWADADELGQVGSGALRLVDLAAAYFHGVVTNCFPVHPGVPMVFGASAFTPDTSEVRTARAILRIYDDLDCGGEILDEVASDLPAALGLSTWSPMQGYGTAPPGAQAASLRLELLGNEPPAELFFDNAYVLEGQSCATTSTVACMNDRRFRVAMSWEIPDGTRGYGSLLAFSGDSLRATFFNPGNVEVVLKVLDGCAVNQRFWVFVAGLTNVEVKIHVTDTHTGEVWEYENPLDQAFAPVQDTSAFADCPH